jgi:hypothetical protein
VSEGPTVTPPERESSPQQRIDVAAQSAYRSNDAPIQPFRVDTSLPFNNRLVIAAENIAMTNARILTNLGEMKTMFSQFNKDSARVNQFREESTQRGRVPGAASTFAPVDPRELTDIERIRALTRIRELHEIPEGLSARAADQLRASRLEALGLGERQGRTLQVGADRFSGEQIDQVLQRARGQIKEPLADNLERLASSIEQSAMQSTRESVVPRTVMERLRSRGMEFWDFANPLNVMNTVAKLTGGQHAVSGRGVTPRMAPTTVPGTVAAEGAEALPAAGGLAKSAGMIERLMAGGGLGGVLSRVGLAAVIPGIGEAAIAAAVVPEILHRLPGVNRLMQLRQGVISLEDTGALTGEGRGAGLAAIREARDLRGGVIESTFHGVLHPFDPITNEIATQIVTSVRTQGFTGRQGRAIEQATASLYRDLRLPIDQTTQLLTDAVRQGGESLQQITREMHGFDDAAHQLQMNINEYAQAISTTAQTLRQGGAGPLATQFAQSFVAGLPRSLRTPEGISTVQQAMQTNAPFIMARTGLMPWQLGTPQALPQQFSAFEATLRQQFGMAQGRTLQERANFASMFLPAFQGMNPLQVRQLMERIQQGRGPGSVAALDQVRHAYSRRVEGLAPLQRQMSAFDLVSRGRAWAAAHGIGDEEWDRITHSFTHDHDSRKSMFRLPRAFLDTSRLSTSRLRALRQETIDKLSGTLTDKQRQELQKHIGDRHWSFDQAIHRYELSRGRIGSGSSITDNGVTITLKGKAEKIFDLNAPNRERAYRGQQSMNTAFPNERSRFDLGF